MVVKSGPHSDVAAGVALPPPPRDISPAVRRRAWAEPRVRFWWLAAVVVLAIAGYFLGTRYWSWRRQADLVRHGLRLDDATVQRTATEVVRGKRQPPNSLVTLDYTVGGRPYTVDGFLVGRTDWIVVGGTVPIYVDRDDPSRWTGLTEVPPLTPELMGGLVLLPVPVALALACLLARARVLRAWRNGQAIEALVLDSRQTAVAPRSRAVRCTPADADDRRVLSVYVPPRLARVGEGEMIRVLAPPAGRAGPAVAAAWFE